MGTMNNIGFHHQIFVNKISALRIIGLNAPHFGSGQNHQIRLFLFQKRMNSPLIKQIQRGPRRFDNILSASLFEIANKGAPDHATMACNKNTTRMAAHE